MTRLEPGWFDRVFNSTISLPQQVIWRALRAWTEEDVDFFSEQGVLDASLLPLFGILDDHKNDVMPDYMAEWMGMADEGQSGFGTQLTAAIVSDPLTYLSGGLSTIGKVAQGANTASRVAAVGRVARAAAAAKNVKLADYMNDLSPQDFLRHIDEAAAEVAQGVGGLTARQIKRQSKTLAKARAKIANNLASAEARNASRAAAKGVKPKSMKMADYLQQTRDRQIAVGLPIFNRWGAKYDIPVDEGSWWKLFKTGVNKGGTALAKATMTNRLTEVPGVNHFLRQANTIIGAASTGSRVASEARVALRTGDGVTPEGFSAYARWLSPDGASPLTGQLAKAGARNDDGINGVINTIEKAYVDAIAKGAATHEEAYKIAFRKAGIKMRGETGRDLWNRLSGATKNSAAQFPDFGAGAAAGKAQIRPLIEKALNESSAASRLHQAGDASVVPVSTELGQLKNLFDADVRELPGLLQPLANTLYNSGKLYRTALNKAFKTGQASSVGQAEYSKFLANVARDNAQMEKIAKDLYGQIKKVTQQEGFPLSHRDLIKIVSKMTELQALPGELAASFHAAAVNPENAHAVYKSMENYLKRQRSTMLTFENLLKTRKGAADTRITASEMRDKLTAALDQDVFPFLERMNDGTEATVQSYFANFASRIQNVSREIEVFSPLQQDILKKSVVQGHLLTGADLPLTAAQRAVAARQIPDIFDARQGIGSVPYNAEIKRRGFTAALTPAQFRSLAIPGVANEGSRKSIGEALRQGKKIGQPFLHVDWDDANKVWRVLNHEGRSRSLAVEDVFGAQARMEVQFMPRGMKAKDITEEMRNAPVVPQAGGAPIKVPLGDPVRQTVRPRRLLERFEGKFAGTLDNGQIADALSELTKAGQRAMTQDEIVAAAKKMPAIQELLQVQRKAGNKISVEELLGVLSKTGKVKDRIVTRAVTQKVPLWDANRTSWTLDQATQHARKYGYELFQDIGANGRIRVVSRHGDAPSLEGFSTVSGAMAALRRTLVKNPKLAKKYGPGLPDSLISKTTNTRITVRAQDLKRAYKFLSNEDLMTLRGKGTVFDDAVLPAGASQHFKRLKTLQQRRALKPGHKLHAAQIKPSIRKVYDQVAPPRGMDEFALFMRRAGVTIDEANFSRFAHHYARGRLLLSEINGAISRHGRLGEPGKPFVLDPTIAKDVEAHVAASGAAIMDLVKAHVPQEVNAIFDTAQKISNYSFEAAKASGVWMPGSPVAYLPRIFNKSAQARISELIGKIDSADSTLLMRLGVKTAAYNKRHLDEMSLDDLNDLYFELRNASMTDNASPALATFHKELDKIMEEAGVGVAGLKKNLPFLKNERLETDPFLTLLQRFGVAQQDRNLAGYFDEMLAASSGKNGDSLMLAGKVVGVIDDTGATKMVGKTKSSVRSVKRGKKGEVKSLAEELDNLDATPRSLIVQLDDGTQHIIENNLLNETGISLLPLGKIEKVSPGVKITSGNLFARASLNSALMETMHNAPLGLDDAAGMLGQHVVFGHGHNITSLVKTASQVHEVTPQAMRAFDSINYTLKSFQTIYRIPFHIANLTSGVFQASMAGATPKNLMASYIDTVRFMFGNQEFSKHATMVSDMMNMGDDVISTGFMSLWNGERTALQQAAQLHGDGSLAKLLAKQDPAAAAKMAQFENLVIKRADGTEIDMAEFIQTAGEMQLYGTYASSLARGSRTTPDTLMRIKMDALEPTYGGSFTGVTKRLRDRMSNRAEASEVINRTATALALVREGHSTRRAIEIAKEAHVPYEKLTPFERNYVKRVSAYYTFPRHYMPWAWTKFMEDPSKLSDIGHFIRDQNIMTTAEGKPTLSVGNYRADLGRLNANLEAAGMLAAFADRLLLPAADVTPLGNAFDARKLRGITSDSGLLSVGGAAKMVWQAQSLWGDATRERPVNNWAETAADMVWPVKYLSMMMGTRPTKEESNPFVQYTPMESILTDSVFGVGLRKVRDRHETQRGKMMFRRMIKQLQMRSAATDDPEKRQRLLMTAQQLAEGFRQLASEDAQKMFK